MPLYHFAVIMAVIIAGTTDITIILTVTLIVTVSVTITLTNIVRNSIVFLFLVLLFLFILMLLMYLLAIAVFLIMALVSPLPLPLLLPLHYHDHHHVDPLLRYDEDTTVQARRESPGFNPWGPHVTAGSCDVRGKYNRRTATTVSSFATQRGPHMATADFCEAQERCKGPKARTFSSMAT